MFLPSELSRLRRGKTRSRLPRRRAVKEPIPGMVQISFSLPQFANTTSSLRLGLILNKSHRYIAGTRIGTNEYKQTKEPVEEPYRRFCSVPIGRAGQVRISTQMDGFRVYQDLERFVDVPDTVLDADNSGEYTRPQTAP